MHKDCTKRRAKSASYLIAQLEVDGPAFIMQSDCMARRRANPIRRYKDRHGLTYPKLAEALDISEDYARKLGAPNGLRTVSVTLAKRIEERTAGEIRFLDLMRWAATDGDAATQGAA